MTLRAQPHVREVRPTRQAPQLCRRRRHLWPATDGRRDDRARGCRLRSERPELPPSPSSSVLLARRSPARSRRPGCRPRPSAFVAIGHRRVPGARRAVRASRAAWPPPSPGDPSTFVTTDRFARGHDQGNTRRLRDRARPGRSAPRLTGRGHGGAAWSSPREGQNLHDAYVKRSLWVRLAAPRCPRRWP